MNDIFELKLNGKIVQFADDNFDTQNHRWSHKNKHNNKLHEPKTKLQHKKLKPNNHT